MTTPSAIMRVGNCVTKAIKSIDEDLGKGYAAKNPHLIGAFVIASSLIYLADSQQEMPIMDVIRALEHISSSIESVASSIESYAPSA